MKIDRLMGILTALFQNSTVTAPQLAKKFEVTRRTIGLDIDALRVVAEGVNAMRSDKFGVLMITHYQRLLDYIVPDFVHVMMDGRIVKSGDKTLAVELESRGYDWIKQEFAPAKA